MNRCREMLMFGCMETEMHTAFRALNDAAYYAGILGMKETAEMLRKNAEDVMYAVDGKRYDSEKWDMFNEKWTGRMVKGDE